MFWIISLSVQAFFSAGGNFSPRGKKVGRSWRNAWTLFLWHFPGESGVILMFIAGGGGNGLRFAGMSKFRILFVCMGNICRSPAAEGVMRHLVEQEHLDHWIECDSAGTIDFHAGEPPDARMRKAAQKRGIVLSGRARQIEHEDFERFDLIVTMDEDNFRFVRGMDSDGRYGGKIFSFVEFLREESAHEVPDPYYQGAEGFERVLDLLEDGCQGMLDEIITRNSPQSK